MQSVMLYTDSRAFDDKINWKACDAFPCVLWTFFHLRFITLYVSVCVRVWVIMMVVMCLCVWEEEEEEDDEEQDEEQEETEEEEELIDWLID